MDAGSALKLSSSPPGIGRESLSAKSRLSVSVVSWCASTRGSVPFSLSWGGGQRAKFPMQLAWLFFDPRLVPAGWWVVF